MITLIPQDRLIIHQLTDLEALKMYRFNPLLIELNVTLND